ncbi:MAG: gliding motility-associated C-terminal domain-containing protein [Bacteroidota bacterium]
MKYLVLILIYFLFSNLSILGQVNLKQGLVACYPFNGNPNDVSGNNNNGTAIGGVSLTTDRFGKANSAYSFNGIDGYINVPNAPSLQFEQISIAMWIKATQFRSFVNSAGTWDRYGGPICRDTRPYGTWNGFTTTTSHGLLRFNLGLSNGSYPDVGIENSITLNNWIFLVFIVENGVAKIYKDGVLAAINVSFSGHKMSTNNNPIYIGRAYWFPNAIALDAYFTGIIDDIHIYNRAITADEVKALYNGITPNPITITSNKSNPCGGDKITFTADGATSSSKFQWKVDGVNQGTNSNNFLYNSPNKSTDYQVKISLEVTDDDPCFPQNPVVVDKIVNVKYCTTPSPNLGNNILISNAFSPNGDGMNDTWEIASIAGNSDVIIEIYNRWGEIIFYSKGYSEPWNGTYKDKPVPEGTYAYIVRVDNETVLRGTVLVVR